MVTVLEAQGRFVKDQKREKFIELLFCCDEMLYFCQNVDAFGHNILIWCFERFQKKDRGSCSLDKKRKWNLKDVMTRDILE